MGGGMGWVVGWGGVGWAGLGWGGRWQKPPVGAPRLGAAMMTVCYKAVGAILGPHHQIGTLHWCHCSSCDFGGVRKCPSRKADQSICNIMDTLGMGSH